jgi:hypothetical protein
MMTVSKVDSEVLKPVVLSAVRYILWYNCIVIIV